MFGIANGTPPPASNRPPASEVARMEGSLTHVLVSGPSSDGLVVFLNGQPVPTGEIESLTLEIIAPDAEGRNGSVSAVLSRYWTGPDGTRGQKAVSLFPGTVEVIARGRRVVIICLQQDSFDGLWLGLGLRADGTSSELSGVSSLRLAAAPGCWMPNWCGARMGPQKTCCRNEKRPRGSLLCESDAAAARLNQSRWTRSIKTLTR